MTRTGHKFRPHRKASSQAPAERDDFELVPDDPIIVEVQGVEFEVISRADGLTENGRLKKGCRFIKGGLIGRKLRDGSKPEKDNP